MCRAHNETPVPWARIINAPLRDLRRLSSDAWYPVVDHIGAPEHFVYVAIDRQPHLVWTGHLEIRETLDQ
jgi:hypothetical protein